ncbi:MULTISPECIES: FadR/GntR family transcriptional regulator [Kaistia]|uniref:FadR/GntR family transcriptional regulator n=1 Tax=Kaistia nematophila TaxID=2994654 RepID=A0A9X3DYM6_9HYPH|nr:FadR/GntR family transcriptional regulator [Kaistia nematophila]MBN9024047.1 FadR family transcriptional regulator [Hyphomicrobiales bacterium]MCX5568049.1 FadR/GntR family transcriptional regulator [Kaistia nematophila]
MTLSVPGLSPLPASDRAKTVMTALADYIAQSGLRPGERLPTERELMQSLAVGRSTVREVIRQFQALGVMESRKGSGTYLLRGISSDTIHMPLSIDAGTLREGLLSTLDIRRGLEAEAGALAALRRSKADLEIIEDRLVAMEKVHLAEGTSGKYDLAFHLSVYDASHNPMFGQLLEQMREAFERFWSKPFDRPDFAGRSFPYHRTLFEAIAAQDAERARRETLTILEIVEEDIREMSQDTAPQSDKVQK